tara:strand:+ start:162 stop:569 length:408 start_codon:yes stop_codon:yes gene_type:complete
VIDKRDNDGLTKRRRECLKCGKRFNTREMVEEIDLRVKKKDGKREDFDSEKLKKGIIKACEKRPVSMEQINKMIAQIESSLVKKGKEVKSESIGDLVSKSLKKADNVSYIRFASVYRNFTDLEDFKKEIKELVVK